MAFAIFCGRNATPNERLSAIAATTPLFTKIAGPPALFRVSQPLCGCIFSITVPQRFVIPKENHFLSRREIPGRD